MSTIMAVIMHLLGAAGGLRPVVLVELDPDDQAEGGEAAGEGVSCA